MLRPSALDPLVRARPVVAAFGGDYQSWRVGVQALRDDLFTHVRAVGVGGVDEVDAQFDGAPHDPDGLGPIRGFAPDPLAGQPHGAEAQPRDAEVASDGKVTGLPGESGPLL